MKATDAARPPPEGRHADGSHLSEDAHPSAVSGPPMNFPRRERTQSIRYKSAMPIGIIKKAGTHLIVHGTNKTNGT